MSKNVKLPKIALGAWAWGNDGTFGNNFSNDALKPIFDTAMANGLNLWDTAYAYGMGTSEKVLANFVKDVKRDSVLISDKFTPQCTRRHINEHAVDVAPDDVGPELFDDACHDGSAPDDRVFFSFHQ